MISAIIGGTVLVAIVAASLLRPSPRDTLVFSPSGARALRIFCQATDTLIGASASTRAVIVDLTLVGELDDQTRAALELTCARWREVGATVTLLDARH